MQNAEGRELTLFDVEIAPQWEHGSTSGSVFYLFAAANAEDGGCIEQMPWNLVNQLAPAPGEFQFSAPLAKPRVNPANQGWAPYRRAAILAGVGVALILGAIVAFNQWVDGLFNPRRPAPVAEPGIAAFIDSG